jgi:dephospho-CoA kinase
VYQALKPATVTLIPAMTTAMIAMTSPARSTKLPDYARSRERRGAFVEGGERERELEARVEQVRERIDRLRAFHAPLDRDLEQRVQDLERSVHVLTWQIPLLMIQAADDKAKALKKVEAMLDRAERGELPLQDH